MSIFAQRLFLIHFSLYITEDKEVIFFPTLRHQFKTLHWRTIRGNSTVDFLHTWVLDSFELENWPADRRT